MVEEVIGGFGNLGIWEFVVLRVDWEQIPKFPNPQIPKSPNNRISYIFPHARLSPFS
jgi:hypothetical protein